MADLTTAEIDEIIEHFKQGIDRTLIRESLKLTPNERLARLQALQRVAAEVSAAGERARRRKR